MSPPVRQYRCPSTRSRPVLPRKYEVAVHHSASYCPLSGGTVPASMHPAEHAAYPSYPKEPHNHVGAPRYPEYTPVGAGCQDPSARRHACGGWPQSGSASRTSRGRGASGSRSLRDRPALPLPCARGVRGRVAHAVVADVVGVAFFGVESGTYVEHAGAMRAKGRDADHDHPGVEGFERRVPEAGAIHVLRREALDDEVSGPCQPPEELSPVGGLQVQGYTLFTGVVGKPVCAGAARGRPCREWPLLTWCASMLYPTGRRVSGGARPRGALISRAWRWPREGPNPR